jgi:hypothetical protein
MEKVERFTKSQNPSVLWAGVNSGGSGLVLWDLVAIAATRGLVGTTTDEEVARRAAKVADLLCEERGRR